MGCSPGNSSARKLYRPKRRNDYQKQNQQEEDCKKYSHKAIFARLAFGRSRKEKTGLRRITLTFSVAKFIAAVRAECSAIGIIGTTTRADYRKTPFL